MTESQFRYDELVQGALRGVVKGVLAEVEKNGLREPHHFYIAFKTGSEGVEIPAYLADRYPEEMTIVLQHRFWGLKVHTDRFEIGLSFERKPEHLKIPFDAIVAFVDPAAQFALQFNGEGDLDAVAENDAEETEKKESPPGAGRAEPQNDHGDDESGAEVVALDSFRQK